MSSHPPTNHLSYLARKTICPRLEQGDFIGALRNAEKILGWRACVSDENFQNQIISIINYCRPLAAQQQRDIEESARLQRLEREKELRRQAEISARRRIMTEQTIATFGPLATKYGAPVDMLVENNEPSELVVILKELDDASLLSDDHYNWLINKNLHLVAARACYMVYQSSGDYWSLVRAGKSLRKAGMPNKVIELVDDQFLSNIRASRVKSALLTNRGGAKRDINDLDGAKGDGLAAAEMNPESFHPHNLLGAVLYQAGDPELGDKHFETALNLGARRQDQEFEIRSAFYKSTPQAREAVRNYLLEKDPIKYAWLGSYGME